MTSNNGAAYQLLQSRVVCVVCGAPAIGRNFDAMTCLSCKAFFRRNAYNEHLIFTCRVSNSCEITSITRRHCSACRLKKCFHRGMKKELIRSLTAINHTATIAIINRSPRPITMDVSSRTDQPFLSSHDWNLLTNIRNAYQQYCIQKFVDSHQFIPLIPPKQPYRSRIKIQRLVDLKYKYTIVIASFIKRILLFDTFQSTLDEYYQHIKDNFQCMLTVNTSELMNSKVLEFLPWEHDQLALQSIFSEEIIRRVEKILNIFQTLLPYDPIIMRLWIIIFALSSRISPLMKKDEYQSTDFESAPKNLLLSQNYYLTLLWKYVTYRIGYNDAIHFIVRFIQNFLQRQILEGDALEIISNRDDYDQLLQLMQVNLHV